MHRKRGTEIGRNVSQHPSLGPSEGEAVRREELSNEGVFRIRWCARRRGQVFVENRVGNPGRRFGQTTAAQREQDLKT